MDSKMKLADIKKVCKEYGVKSTGTKFKLLERIRIAKFLQEKAEENFTLNSIPKKVTFKSFNDNISSDISNYQKFFSFVSKKNSNEIIGKLDNRNAQIYDLSKEDIEFCKSKHLKYIIPIVLKGKEMTHRVRNVVEEEEDDDDEEEENLALY